MRPLPVCQILPPHLLEQVVRNGSPAQRDRALDTLATDTTIRLVRASTPRLPPAGARLLLGVEPAPVPVRTISDAGHTTTLPGRAVRTESGPPSDDPAVEEAFDGLGATFAFYLTAYGRDSIDGEGLPLDATVHFGDNYDNAFWNGERMVFGDGDGQLFRRFTVSLDVIGHELTHGVTQDEASLQYAGQPGALNESLSDVFGSLVKQFTRRQTADQADWLIGADLLEPGVAGRALRDMAAPGTAYDDPVLGKDPQVASFADYVRTTTDNGGVHINSGIPNKAFVVTAKALGGYAWERAGRVWYDALRDPKLRPRSGFRTFAGITVAQAQHQGSEVADAVRAGWDAVGVPV